MKRANLIRSIAIALIAMLAASLAATAANPDAPNSPATRPATRPLYSIKGTVRLGLNLDLAAPDLSRVVVYLESDPSLDAISAPSGVATVAQRNKAFVPNFLVVRKDTVVEFPNWDHFSHNVFSRSAAAPAFDLDRYPYGQSKSRTFDKTGVVQIFCNIHPSMKAIIFVAPSAFFTRADAEGNFKIEGVPAGSYTVAAWQERCQTQRLEITVGPGEQPSISFRLDESRDGVLAGNPPRRDQGYGVERGLGQKRERLNLPVVTDSHPAPTTEPCPDCQ